MTTQPEKSRERTLGAALLLSAPGPLVTAIAAVTSQSATQLADCIRRTAELAATFMSWWVYRKILKNPGINAADTHRLQRRADRTVAIAMLLSGFALLFVGIFRLFAHRESGNVVLGLIIAALGLVVNFFFWLRYRRMNREVYDPVIAAQQRLYRAKAVVDFCVVTALLAVAVAPGHPVSRYLDAIGTMAVAVYLLYQGFRALRKDT